MTSRIGLPLLAFWLLLWPCALLPQSPLDTWEAEAAALRKVAQPADRPKLLDLYRRIAETAFQQQQQARAAKALIASGQILDQSGDPKAAKLAFEKASAVLRFLPRSPDRVSALYGLAKNQAALADHEAAITTYTQALDIQLDPPNLFQRGLILNNLAASFWALGNNDEALPYYQQALELRSELVDLPGIAYTQYGITLVHWTSGERQLALNAAARALSIWQQQKNPFGEANTWNSMGLLYAELGDIPRANHAYTQALRGWRAAKSPLMEAYTINNLGMLLMQQKQYRSAANHFARAMATFVSNKDARGIAYVRHNQADLFLHRNQPRQALNLYCLSLIYKEQHGDRFGAALTSLGIAKATAALGDAAAAEPLFQQALERNQEIHNVAGEFATLTAFARFFASQQNVGTAGLFYLRAIDLAEDARSSLTDTDLRVSYFTTVQNVYTEYIDLLCQQARTTKDPSLYKQAFQSHEASRARQLGDDLLRAYSAASPSSQGRATQWMRKEQDLRRHLRAAAQRLERSYSAPTSEALREQSRRSFDMLWLQWKSRTSLSGSSVYTDPGPIAVPRSLESTLVSLQSTLRNPSTAVFAFRLGPQHSHLWRITATDVQHFYLPAESQITPAVRRYLEALTARDPDSQPPASEDRSAFIQRMDAELPQRGQQLSRLLFANALRGLDVSRILFIPDGVLHNLPFAALPQPYRPTESFVARWQLASIPSVNVYLSTAVASVALPEEAATTVMADPVFDADDPRVHTDGRKSTPSSPASPAQRHAEPALARLRFTAREAEAIKRYADRPVQSFEGFQATRERLLEPPQITSSILHLATHAWVDTQSPAASGIAFTSVNQRGEPIDGVLRLFDIYDLQLSSKLVVLSSCRTALGRDVQGEGIDGLVRAFLQIRVPRVIATLWNVQDSSSAELMGNFYEAHLKQHRSVAESLQQAQKKAMLSPHTKHPYYWAGYKLEGHF